MQYMLLIYDDESQWATMTPEEGKAVMGEYFAYTTAIREQGIFQAGAALQRTATGKTVRVRGGDRTVVDGPFAETREQLGGYYLVECASEEEALEAASRIPSARFGSIEVRPVAILPPEYPT